MSRTHVHKPLKFVVPVNDTAMGWKRFYSKHYGRFRSEKKEQRARIHQERARLRVFLGRSRYFQEDVWN